MKRTFHLCLSSNDEVMFRDEEDYNRGFNTFALALYKTDSTGLVESFMTNHVHKLVQTADPNMFMGAFRMPYTKYFNRKYARSGALGESRHFSLEIRGLHHHLAAMSYILRNALHHGVAPIPYAYPHSSVNAIFQREMGKQPERDLLSPSSYYRYIGRRAEFPDTYKMSKSGLFLRESVLDIPQVENMFSTPRKFDFYMNRKSSEEWLAEQSKDKENVVPITLELIESNIRLNTPKQMMINEGGIGDYRRASDMEVCAVIDKVLTKELNKPSVYVWTREEKIEAAKYLRTRFNIGDAQLYRCLAMGYSK